MVLWELTVATAYFLGLRKTYRLALRAQRRILGRRFPRLSYMVHRRTRNIFDIALACHKKIQAQDILAGRTLGNYILRILDRMKPTANISGSAADKSGTTEVKNSLFLMDSKKKQADGGYSSRIQQANKRKDVDSGRLLASQQMPSSQFGLAIRRKITVGLEKFKPTPGMVSGPGLALRLWWQPIRQNMEAFHVARSWNSPSLSSLNAPSSNQSWKSYSCMSNKLVRDDIAAWMRA